jgi:ketosteroid isomerase-like protein
VDKDKKQPKQLGSTPGNVEGDVSGAAHRSNAGGTALDDFFQTLRPEMKRSKPNQEAVAAALQAVQHLADELDVEETANGLEQVDDPAARKCQVCGYYNRAGSRFCGMCGLPVGASTVGETGASPQSVKPGREVAQLPRSGHLESEAAARSGAAVPRVETHHYHHHYHHHYFPGAQENSAPRSSPEASREADRLRVAAAQRGESMSRSEAAVRGVGQAWVLACNTKHLDDLLELYVADALVLRSNCPAVRGAAAIREFFFSALGAGLGDAELESIRIEIAGDMAFEAGRFKALVPGATGKRREERGKYLWVLAKQNQAEWKIASDCWSSDLMLAVDPEIAPAAATKVNPIRKGT